MCDECGCRDGLIRAGYKATELGIISGNFPEEDFADRLAFETEKEAIEASVARATRVLEKFGPAHEPAPNGSGLQPCEYKVLVKPDEVPKKAGELYIPDRVTEKEKKEQVFGVLLAAGGNAFEDWKEPVPKPGDRVLVAKYAGVTQKGLDGEYYTLMYDKDIASIVDKGVTMELSLSNQPDMAGDGEYANLRSQ